MSQIELIVWILGAIAIALAIVALLYIISSQRRKSITLKKIDYLVEDITYKSEMLNSTVETVAKISNYIDVFEVFARKNMKSLTKVITNNKDDIYKILGRVKKLATGEAKEKQEPKNKKRGS